MKDGHARRGPSAHMIATLAPEACNLGWTSLGYLQVGG